jgi:DNA-binding NarL/FixJ family response regulator
MYPLLFIIRSYCWQQSLDSTETRTEKFSFRAGNFFSHHFDSPVPGCILPLQRGHMYSARSNSNGFVASSARRASVIVADPYPIILLGIRKIVEDDPRFQLVGEVSTMASLREKIVAQAPDVALVDWSMASQSLGATGGLLRSDHATAMVFLTVSNNVQDRRDMVRLGARGILSKCASPYELQEAVWQALHGRMPLETPVAEPSTTSIDPEHHVRQLTRRERQLIPLVCGGLRNKEIAQQLGISESTVWHHLTSVFTKLRVEDRLGLAAFAYRHGLVLPAESASIALSLSAD